MRKPRSSVAVFLAVRFTTGQVHATPWDRHPNEAAVEWPPSPWRLLRALYAVWKERVSDLPAEVVSGLLAALAVEPPTYRVPPAAHAHTRHWYPSSTHTSHPKGYKKGLALDAFMALDPRAALYVSYDATLTEDEADALTALAAQMTYLGRAESRVDVVAVIGAPPTPSGYINCAPAPEDHGLEEEGVRLLVPSSPLDLDALVTGTRAVQRKRLTIPPGSYQLAYTSPTQTTPLPVPDPGLPRRSVTGVLWHLTAPALPSVRVAVLQGEAVHRQVLHEYKQVSDGAHSRTLSGCDPAGVPLRDNHQHAHVLHYDLDGDGLLDTALLWAPKGLDDLEVRAISHARRLQERPWLREFRAVTLGLEYLGDGAALPAPIVGPSRQWTSLTPFAPPHHAKRRQRDGVGWTTFVEAQVHKACQWRGLPEPTAVRVRNTEPWLGHRRHRTREHLNAARRAVGVSVEFDESLYGPLALGSLSHYGLGLLVPLM